MLAEVANYANDAGKRFSYAFDVFPFFGGVRKTLSRDFGCVGYAAMAVFPRQRMYLILVKV
jgi:hypothetical protein